jgi:hypothetical protein
MPEQALENTLGDMNFLESSDAAIATEPYLVSVGLQSPESTEEEVLRIARPDLNGIRIQQAGSSAIYLVDRGQKRHIPDPQTFNNLFKNWSHHEVLDIDSIETGIPLPSGAILAAPIGEGTVYLLDGGCKRHVTGPAVMTKYNFNWDRVYKLPPISLANIPLGDPII